MYCNVILINNVIFGHSGSPEVQAKSTCKQHHTIQPLYHIHTTTTTITTVQLKLQFVHAFSICTTALEKDHHHHHHTVQVIILRPTTTTTTTTTAQYTMHAFSICATALGKRPPPPPSHSASYNVTSNHHYHHHRHHYNAFIHSFMYFTQSTIELGAQEAWPINVLPRWLKVTWYNIE